MSYLDSINNQIAITTGDGRGYITTPGSYGLKVMQQSMSRDVTYNISEFSFINLAGKLVKQTTTLGRVFPVEIYIDGPDHLTIGSDFERSCNNPAPWRIDHPIYGIIAVKAATLSFSNAAISYTKITGTLIETMQDGKAKSVLLAIDQVEILKIEYVDKSVAALTATPTTTDITSLTLDNATAYQKAVPIIPSSLPEEFETFNNAYNTAVTYINIATTEPLLMMRSVTQVLLLPAQFSTAVRQRLNVLIDTFNTLRQTLFGIIGVSSKQLFQNKAGALIASMCSAAATPLPDLDYKNSNSVLEVIGDLMRARSAYYEDMDSLQTENGGSPTSFVPDAAATIALDTLINTTIIALYDIALNTKSQRTIICEKDTNIILLAHRVYGLDKSDTAINELIANNTLSLNELMLIQKDREIVYFV